MKKINKTTARKLYNSGINFTIVPCKCSPERWGMEVRSAEWNKNCRTFDQLYNEYTYYNCGMEVGTYPAFYVES